MAAAPFAAAVFGLGVALMPGSIGIFEGLRSSLAIDPAFVGQLLTLGGIVALLLTAAVGWWSLLRRYHAA